MFQQKQKQNVPISFFGVPPPPKYLMCNFRWKISFVVFPTSARISISCCSKICPHKLTCLRLSGDWLSHTSYTHCNHVLKHNRKFSHWFLWKFHYTGWGVHDLGGLISDSLLNYYCKTFLWCNPRSVEGRIY